MRWPRFIRTRRGKLDLAGVNTVRRRFARYVRPHWKALAAALAAMMAAVAMTIAAPWPIKLIFDVILSDAMAPTPVGQWFARNAPQPLAALAITCGAILLIALAEAVFAYFRDVLLAQTGHQVTGRIRHDLFRHMQRLSPEVFESRRAGDLLLRLTGDIQMLRQMIVTAWVTAAQNILVILATVAVMFWLNATLTAIALLALPLIFWSAARISKRIRRATESQREKESHVASIAHEVLGAMSVVQAFNRERIEQRRFARQNRSSIRAGVKTTRLEARLFRIVSLASAAGLCAVLYVGVRSVLSGAMTAGDLLVFVAYLRAVNKPLRQFSKLAAQTAKATTCGLRIAEIFQIPPAIEDAPDAVTAERFRGEIEFAGVDFFYRDGTHALKELSLILTAGRRVAVVGRSGAGKSTMMKLLLRFHDPTGGQVRIDGEDIRRFAVTSLRDQIAVVQQETVLFGLTVTENIALGCEQVDPAAVRRAAKAVGAHAFIKSLPDGYDTVLSERATTLSGGQRQRIALARALLRNPSILILDEPVTGMDPEAARQAERTWMLGRDGRTTLVICHHLAAMERFDQIVVLEGGRLADVGAHQELLARCEPYAALHHAWRTEGAEPMAQEEGDAYPAHRLAC